MSNRNRLQTYYPGYYGRKGLRAAEWAERAVQNWNREQKTQPGKIEETKLFPAICFSRQIGVGALEIADKPAEQILYSVADREILEYTARDAGLSEYVVACAFEQKFG